MEKIYGMHKLVGLQLFWSRTPNFSNGTPTFCQMGVLNSCFQNPSESSGLRALLISDLDGQDQTSFVNEVHSDTEEESDGSEASGMFIVDL